MIVLQRPDIVLKMLVSQKFKHITCAVYDNNLNPSSKDELSDYNIIDEIDLLPELWTINTINNSWDAEYPELEWEFYENFHLYGYLMFDRKGKLLFSERFFGGPFVFPNMGGKLSLKPKIRFN